MGSSSALLKGASASATRFTASSASLTLASDSLMRPSAWSFSALSRIVAVVASSFSCSSFTTGCIFAISSLAMPEERDCASRYLASVLTETWASAEACSASFDALPLLDPFSPSAPSLASDFSSAASSEPKASTSSATLAIFSCVALSLPWASSMTFFAARRCSTVEESFLYLPTSAWAVLSLVWYLMSSALTSVEVSLPLASICLAVRNFLASARAAFAACSALMVSSEAVRISLEESAKSFASSSKTDAASPTFLASSSALATSCSASRIVADFLRSAVPRLSSVSFFVCASSSAWFSLSFAWASLLGPAEKRFASTIFVAMNILAMETAVFAEVAAVSQLLIAARVSARGSSSTPMRNGPSASAALATVSATVCSFSAASFSSVSQVTRSAASLCAFLNSWSRCCEALVRSSIFAISASASPEAPFFFCSRNFCTTAMWSPALVTACSACCIISLDRPSPVNMTVASSALSTSTSAGESFSSTSCTSFCAAVRFTKSCRTLFSGFSLFCASWRFVWSLPSSVAASCFTLSLSKRLELASLALRYILASPMDF
mmetsp:Transcript_117126/g.377980  ORF Transcript_117126/g.377980 Transcript_117126/m.377980 type:complete len:555 (-) Transcript_117126:426-2090(-)